MISRSHFCDAKDVEGIEDAKDEPHAAADRFQLLFVCRRELQVHVPQRTEQWLQHSFLTHFQIVRHL